MCAGVYSSLVFRKPDVKLRDNSTTAQQPPHTEELQRNIRTRRSAGLGRGAVSLKTSRTGSQLGGGAGRGAEEGSGGGGVTEEEEEETLPGLSCQLNTAPLPTIECFYMFDKLISSI